ncbi:hypothetical protein UY3_02612 [Chelonia mydas]|uniref:Uncharacterized protein n=1 Tax=Chelonia mydas TaxID=8469 RepID=M7BWL5_CHEMY|nr:hypothetical protein UY3_02612 [Chelonia mydas]
MDICKGGVSRNRDEDFVDEEDEEEEEVEDSAQQAAENPFSLAARNCSSPWSQYPPNPPKAGSWTMEPEKAPLVLHILQDNAQGVCNAHNSSGELSGLHAYRGMASAGEQSCSGSGG